MVLIVNRLIMCRTLLVCSVVLTLIWLLMPASEQQYNSVPIAMAEHKAPFPLSEEQLSAILQFPPEQMSDAQLQDQAAIILQLPSSLLGSVLPSPLDMNAQGDLVINKKIQHLFDFYLSAQGEESLGVIVARIKQSLKLQLTSSAFEQCSAILAGYLRYLNEITAIKQQYELDIDSEYALENVISARELMFAARAKLLDPEVIYAFFGQADQYEDYMLSLVGIMQYHGLTPAQKLQAKADLDAVTPDWLLAQQQSADRLNQYRSGYKKLQSQGATADELSDFTQQLVSPEVAARLAELENKRQQWQSRLAVYREELIVITAIDMDNQQQQEQIGQLRELYFSEQEIKRVNALDNAYLAAQSRRVQ